MKIHLLSRIRNESHIIADSIRHWRGFVTGKMAIYDDFSTDDTRQKVQGMPDNITLIKGKQHHKDRDFANYWCREMALRVIRRVAKPGDWVVCADADERIELDWDRLATVPDKYKSIAVRLFDYYITPEDVGKGWQARQWIGPEYRDIIMIWRHDEGTRFDKLSQRVPNVHPEHSIQMGYCHHFGKAISVVHWEAKCKYYQGHFKAQPQMRKKWQAREGKAVKRDFFSDFKNPLIPWDQKDEKGIPLTAKIYEREFE